MNLSDLDIVTKQIVATDEDVISGKHFKCDGKPYQPLIVTGANIRVEDSIFTDCFAGITLSAAGNTIITGNRFENVGVAIREKDESWGTTIMHNEFEGVGALDCTQAPEWQHGVNGYWACDVFLSDGGKDGKFNSNIIDNRGYQTRWIEDFINLFGTGGGFEVKNNLFIGSSESESSSSSGGCIIVDGLGSNYEITDNQCFNVAGYGMGSAGGSNTLFLNNLVYMTKQHALTLSHHPKHSVSGGTYSFGSTNYNKSCGENVQVIGNEAFTAAVDYPLGEPLIDRGNARNLLEDCPVNSENNVFYDVDPQISIPTNVFDALDGNYFSGRRG